MIKPAWCTLVSTTKMRSCRRREHQSPIFPRRSKGDNCVGSHEPIHGWELGSGAAACRARGPKRRQVLGSKGPTVLDALIEPVGGETLGTVGLGAPESPLVFISKFVLYNTDNFTRLFKCLLPSSRYLIFALITRGR